MIKLTEVYKPNGNKGVVFVTGTCNIEEEINERKKFLEGLDRNLENYKWIIEIY